MTKCSRGIIQIHVTLIQYMEYRCRSPCKLRASSICVCVISQWVCLCEWDRSGSTLSKNVCVKKCAYSGIKVRGVATRPSDEWHTPTHRRQAAQQTVTRAERGGDVYIITNTTTTANRCKRSLCVASVVWPQRLITRTGARTQSSVSPEHTCSRHGSEVFRPADTWSAVRCVSL